MIISGYFWDGPEDRLLRECLAGHYQIITSNALLHELDRVLDEKFRIPGLHRRRLLNTLKDAAIVVIPKTEITLIIDDPADNRVLESALTGDADAIISGDKHLLRLQEFHGIPVLQAAIFRAKASGARGTDV